MNWSLPVEITISEAITPLTRLMLMFGHLDCRFYITEHAYLDLGAGSLGVVDRIISVPPETRGCIGQVGRFVEMNISSKILVAGEHDNDSPVNVTFVGFPVLGEGYAGGLKPLRPFSIGNGVVVSAGVHVLGGVSIGDGAVIGAGAVVTRDVADFSVSAGVPARELRRRTKTVSWWDFDPVYLLENRDRIQEVAANPAAEHRYRRDMPRLVLASTKTGIDLKGYLVAGDLVRPKAMPPHVADYFVQAVTAAKPSWKADPWAA